MKEEYIETVISCDNCGEIIVEVEGSIDPWDYDYSAHPDKDRIDECDLCHQICIEEELKEQEPEEQEKPTLIISDGNDCDLEAFIHLRR